LFKNFILIFSFLLISTLFKYSLNFWFRNIFFFLFFINFLKLIFYNNLGNKNSFLLCFCLLLYLIKFLLVLIIILFNSCAKIKLIIILVLSDNYLRSLLKLKTWVRTLPNSRTVVLFNVQLFLFWWWLFHRLFIQNFNFLRWNFLFFFNSFH